ncbi:MAG: putative Ig domain-containing protein, partial [Candidatus Korobacteraceae bacterium]
MRSIHWLVLSLTAVFLLLGVCSSGGSSIQPPSALSYATSTAIYTKGVLVTANVPASTGGAVTLYGISPALPAGLSLSSSTGIISGTPTAVTAANSYTVTASNLSGSTTATLTITVIDAPTAQSLPNLGQQITPLAPQDSRFEPMNPDLPDNPAWLAGQAVTTVVSPDGKTLLVLTSGYNRVYNTDSPSFKWSDSKEYVFIYDISKHTPVKKQVVQVPNTYNGIVFDPSGKAFYVSGGMGDFPFDKAGDNVHIVALSADGTWLEQPGTELALGHRAGLGLAVPNDGLVPINSMVFVQPCAAGVAISNDGKTLVVANYYNDSITMFKGGLGSWSKGTELDLRPGKSDPS